MQPLGRFIRGIWHALDTLRRVLHLLLLLALFGIVIGALRQAVPRVPERAALLVRPSGEIVEQLSGEPIERALNEAEGTGAPQTLLWDLTTAIRAAATDPRITALVLDTDQMGACGQVKLEELAAAITDFRRSGKKVIAHGTYFLQSQYYLAAQADELYLDPFGFVLLDGYSRYRLFFKDALEKLSIDMHLFRVGKFKSAAETYTRQDMSAEDRLESQSYLNVLWSGYVASVAAARHLKPEAIRSYSDDYAASVAAVGGDTAKLAHDDGLVTELRTASQVEQRLIELVGADPGTKSYRQVGVADYLRASRAEDKLRGKGAGVGVVIASGEILDGKQPPGTVGGDSTAALLRTARQDGEIRAVVLRVDSPGGSVLATEQIYREVRALKAAGKPVVVSMSDLAASGGYYIAAPADEIIASANTITGSIGVFAALPTFSRTLSRLGINVDGVATTPLAGAAQLDRPLSPEAARVLQSTVDHVYGEFIDRVASGRGKSHDAIDAVAQGRVWAGVDARTNGLIDRFGSYQDAVAAAAKRAGLAGSYGVRRIEPELSLTQQLLFQLRDGIVAWLARSGVLQAPDGAALLQQLRPLDREIARWARLRSPDSIYAYCFCGIE